MNEQEEISQAFDITNRVHRRIDDEFRENRPSMPMVIYIASALTAFFAKGIAEGSNISFTEAMKEIEDSAYIMHKNDVWNKVKEH